MCLSKTVAKNSNRQNHDRFSKKGERQAPTGKAGLRKELPSCNTDNYKLIDCDKFVRMRAKDPLTVIKE